jgi:Domain of unknown function (DUF4192)
MTTVLTAREPEDLLAAVPVVLGFYPEQSLVMLTFGAGPTFHARVDLPPPADEEALYETVDAVLGPSRFHAVEHVAFLVYTADPVAAARLAAALVPAFAAEGISVVDVLRVHESRWCRVPLPAGAEETTPALFRWSAHPFAAHAVFEGRVTLASRDELRRTVTRDAETHARWEVLVSSLPEPGRGDDERALALVAGWVGSGAEPDDAGAARVLGVVARVDVRDAALYTVTQQSARDHLRVWSALLRGAPDAQVPDTAAVAAFCAWQAGDGALAWCALDRCFEVEPDHRLGGCLAECLSRAVPPATWSHAPVARLTLEQRPRRPLG